MMNNSLSRHDARRRATAFITRELLLQGHSAPYSYLMAFMATKTAPVGLWEGRVTNSDHLRRYAPTLMELVDQADTSGTPLPCFKWVNQGDAIKFTGDLMDDGLDEVLSQGSYQKLWDMVSEAEGAI